MAFELASADPEGFIFLPPVFFPLIVKPEKDYAHCTRQIFAGREEKAVSSTKKGLAKSWCREKLVPLSIEYRNRQTELSEILVPDYTSRDCPLNERFPLSVEHEPVEQFVVHRSIFSLGDLTFDRLDFFVFGELHYGDSERPGTYVFIGDSYIEFDMPPSAVGCIAITVSIVFVALSALVFRRSRNARQ